MEYEVIELLKQSPKSTVHLVREKDSGQILIRKVLKGAHPVYAALQEHPHPCLPVLHEVTITEDSTTVAEEYIEGQPQDSAELSETRFLAIVRELCSVLEFLHGQGIIHRDIKPSNIIMAKDGHIRLIDFDAARMPKENLEQDTVLLGTRGFAPPEQYGFAQTDERADIYSLGVTLKQLGGRIAEKPHYKRVIRKCTDLDPAKRYQSVRQVRRAFFRTAVSFRGKILPHGKSILCASVALCILLLAWIQAPYLYGQLEDGTPVDSEETLAVLPAPANPHWDGNTGIAVWGNVPESIVAGNFHYYWILYRKAASDTDEDILIAANPMSGNHITEENFTKPLSVCFEENGFYYFMVCAKGDGIQYADSPYVTSDLFEFTGESAPLLPLPTDLAWCIRDIDGEKNFYAIWSNLDEYESKDYFNVIVYDKDGSFVMNNTLSKENIMARDVQGIPIRSQYLSDVNNSYRFTLEIISSRPNEYRTIDPDFIEVYSPWYNFYNF